jgi:hypothetical protein
VVITRHIRADRWLTLAPEAHLRTAIDASIRRIGPNDGKDHELCVPLVALKGDSYRLKDRDLGPVPTDERP